MMLSPIADAYPALWPYLTAPERDELAGLLAGMDPARAEAERSPAAFLRAAWPLLEPGANYHHNWHIDCIAEHLEAVEAGEITRLLINQPPRSLKSTLVTVCWPLWCWLRRPELRFMFASYAQTLATFHSVQRRLLLQSDWFAGHWGRRVRLAGDRNRQEEFSNTRQGTMIATSVGGSSLGKGGDILVFDDPLNPTEAASPALRESANAWIRQGFLTRLNDPKTGRVVGVMQRLHEEDTSGMLLAQGGWTHLCLPAEAERRTVITFPRSGHTVIRKAGEPLHATREGTRELARRKVELGSYGYAGQYQQRPSPEEGGLLKREWWRRYREAPRCAEIIQSWDCAFKGGDTSDYVVGQVWGRRDAERYLLDQVRARADFPSTLRLIRDLVAKWPRTGAVLIEDKANGSAVLATLRRDIPGLVAVTPAGGKTARVHAVSAAIEAGNVYLPDNAPWLADFLEECAAFPHAAHDDQVDAMSQALLRLKHTPWHGEVAEESDGFETLLERLGESDVAVGGNTGW